MVQLLTRQFSRPVSLSALALALMLAGCGGGGSVASAPMTGQAAAPEAPSGSVLPPVSSTAPTPTAPKIPEASATLGLLLPLSGTNGQLGQALDHAAEMALFDAADTKTALVVRDTETPQGPAGAAQAALDEGANILLGPIFADHARQVGPVAANGHVADVAFTTDKSVAGNGVYVMGILPGLQIDRIVDYASQQGRKSFAAIAPDNA